MELMNSIVI